MMRSGTHLLIDLILNNFAALRTSPLYIDADRFLRESGSSKELLFQIGYTLGLAWVMAFVIYQGGKSLGLG